MTPLDYSQTRPTEGGASYPLGHRLTRLVWQGAWLVLARWTPVPLFGWRNMIARLFGARLDKTARIYPSVRIWHPRNLEMAAHSALGPNVNCYCMAPVTLRSRALVSQGASLCAGTHDVDDPHFQLIVKPIVIGEKAWVAAEAFVGPGVTIDDGAVLGARGVAMKSIPAGMVYAGNPARLLRARRL